MNLPVAQTVQLPAHLQALKSNTALAAINTAASAGISSGGWPRIGIKAARFRLQTPQGEEVVVPENHLDVIIVDANPNGLQKIFYTKAYDPNADEAAPDCYSDNGVGPSVKSTKPQCGTCAACPQNVWGSKILPNGKQGKACADVKKTAVLIANNPSGPVFEFRIPPASLANFQNYVKSLDNRGVPAGAVVTRLTFDTAADYPKLMFAATQYSNEEQAAAILEVIGTEEVDQCTGKNDKPIDPAKLLTAPPRGPIPTAPRPEFVAAPSLPVNEPLPAFLQGVASPPLAPTPVAAPIAQAPAEAPKRRGRGPAKAAPAAAPATDLFGQPVAASAPPAASAQSAAQVAVPIQVATTDAALDAMLAEAMKV